MRRHVLSVSLFVLALSGGAASVASPQAQELTLRGPRFVAAWKTSGEAVDVSNAVVLRRRVSLDLTNVTADEALKEITRQADLEISYSTAMLPSNRSVSLHAREITVAAALTEVLLEAGVDVAVARGGHMALVKRPASMAVPVVDSGVVFGRVTDKETGAPIVGAAVVIEGTRHAAITGADGGYRIVNVLAGTYEVRARYIGYEPSGASITVNAGAEIAADLALMKSVQVLDEVVTTGTLIPTEVKALPTPVTVIDQDDIALHRPRNVPELFRQAVPGGTSYDLPGGPYLTNFSTRGATSLFGGLQVKVLVDGVEAATSGISAVDPASIDRIEVIRGPQAAAIYGSEAIGGVIQIFTKRGDPNLRRPQAHAEVAYGLLETPYATVNNVLRQEYSASVQGGGADAGFLLGGGYSRLGSWIPEGEISAQSTPTAYASTHFASGVTRFDVSGRLYTQNAPPVNNPELFDTGLPFLRPTYLTMQIQNLTVGARFSVTPTSWWQHTVTAGYDRWNQDFEQTRPRLAFPGDTLLAVLFSSNPKTSLGYHTSVHGPIGRNVSGSLTMGIDHWNLSRTDFNSFSALRTRGVIETAPGTSIAANRNFTKNTGYFAQSQLGWRDALFFTGGLRFEENSDFGDSLGTVVSPRLGLSYVQPVGQATLKLRGSWGRAIRTPNPGLKAGTVTLQGVTLANPRLGPERQEGWDAGVDIVFGNRGSVGVTYYNQIAKGLIDRALLMSTPTPTFQFQNVGRIRNIGIEFEARLATGSLELKTQYAYTKSRVEELAPGYGGFSRVGDQVFITPKHSAGALLAVTPFRTTTLSAGFAYVGDRKGPDWVGYFRCLGGTGACRNETFALDRDYLIPYEGFVKIDATVSQQLTANLSGFVSLDNLTNNESFEADNITPVIGRITTIGIRARY